MGFLNPWVFGAMAAVAVPIAIHLLNKFRVRQTVWAAMRFVGESVRKNRKRVELQDLLLLLLRCLVVILLVLAFTQPVLQEVMRGATGGSGPMSAVVILDHSASMEQSNGIVTRFEDARQRISDWVSRLESGSGLAFYLASNRTEAIVPRITRELPRIRRSLELVEPSNRSTDLYDSIAAAYETLRDTTGDSREIHLFTDSQRSGWARYEDIRQLQQDHPEVYLHTHVLGESGEDNLAVVAVELQGGIPALNQAVRYRIDVANFGQTEATGIRVTLGIDGGSPADEAFIDEIPPGGTESVDLFARFSEAGFHTVTAAIPPDRFPLDNERTTALRVVDRMRVLVLEGGISESRTESDGFFLANALVPVSFERVAGHYLSVSTQPIRRLSQLDLASYDLVFLCDVPALDPRESQLLQGFVERGGALVVFPGPRTRPERWNKDPVWETLLPARWGELRESEDGFPIQSSGYEHPVATIWQDPREGNFGAVNVYQHYRLEVPAPNEEDSGARVILRLRNGEPLAVEGDVGLGKVALFGSTANPAWNNLPLHPGFVPLVQKLTGYLTDTDGVQLVLNPGEAFVFPMPTDTLGLDYSVIYPGEDRRKRPAGSVELDEQRALIRFQDTDRAGPYEIYIGDEEIPRAKFAVQIDAEESDLRQLPVVDIERLEVPPQDPAHGSSSQDAFQPRKQVTFEFWTLLVVLAALASLVEAGLAHYWSRAR